MTPQDHNKTLGIIYSALGGFLTVGALVEMVRVIIIEKEVERIASSIPLQILIFLALVLTGLLLLTAYGLFKRRGWARISSLILAGLFIWFFPLGTALSIYTWWFMFSEGRKQLYSNSSS